MVDAKISNAALKQFEERFSKSFGEGTIKRTEQINPYEVISTGSLTLDYRLSVGGYVEGRLVEIWGPEGVGKTRLSIMGMVEAQRKYPNKMVGFIDMEQKFDPSWAVLHGLDLTRLYLITPKNAEEVADALKSVCDSGLFSMAVVDSVGAMVPQAEKEKGAAESAMGRHAGIVTRMVKIAAVEAAKSRTVVLLLNQVRASLSAYGADTTTGGGFALKHATTMKLKMRRTAAPPLKVTIDKEVRVVGHEISIQVERNGVAPAYRTANVTMLHVPTEEYGSVGIDRADEAVSLGVDTGVIQQGGAWYTTPDGKRHQGRQALVNALRNSPELVDTIRKNVLASVASEIIEEVDPKEISSTESMT